MVEVIGIEAPISAKTLDEREPFSHANRHSPIQCDHRRWIDALQLAVESGDLRPVCPLCGASLTVQRW